MIGPAAAIHGRAEARLELARAIAETAPVQVIDALARLVDKLHDDLAWQRARLAPRLAAMDEMGRMFDGMFR